MCRHRVSSAALAVAVTLILAACGTTPPAGPQTPATADTEPATPTATRTSAPSQSPSESTVPVTGFGLDGDGLGGMKWGANADDVEALLIAEFGAPSDTYDGPDCELNADSPWSRTLTFGALGVHFVAEGTERDAVKYLRSWSLDLTGDIDSALAIADGLPTDTNFPALEQQYPDGTLETSPLDDETEIFTHPNGIRYIGSGTPELMQAGELSVCD